MRKETLVDVHPGPHSCFVLFSLVLYFAKHAWGQVPLLGAPVSPAACCLVLSSLGLSCRFVFSSPPPNIPGMQTTKAGQHRFRPAWRARESEIKILARRGYEKKQKARRLETLHDTSLCKVLQSTAEPNPEEPAATPEAFAATRMLQIDVIRWFRQGIRQLREKANPESPCNFGYPERMVHRILHLQLHLQDVTL